MNALMIAGIEIHKDQDGRFSLNDFHRAAGGENRHKPSLCCSPHSASNLFMLTAVMPNFAPTDYNIR